MTREEAIGQLKFMLEQIPKEPPSECDHIEDIEEWLDTDRKIRSAFKTAIKALEQEPCEMTVEEYRQRMIQAFHNADCDELIAICALPTEKEFEHLEWLLKTHYKKEPCEDAISRENLLLWLDDIKESNRKHVGFLLDVQRYIRSMPPVTPQPKTGHWIAEENEEMKTVGYYCSECDLPMETEQRTNFCPNCGAKMEEELQWFDIA